MQALQSIVARNVDPLQNAVISVTTINAGDAFNVIPQRAKLTGTGRSLDPLVRDLLERRMREVVQNVAAAYGATAKFAYERNYPVTVNHVASRPRRRSRSPATWPATRRSTRTTRR